MISEVSIEVHNINDITQLKSAFFTTPFKVIDIREDKISPLLELMIMSSSPGILDKDKLYFNYLLHENSKLQITTQSYQRLFSMQEGAVQKTKIAVKENAYLSFLPHPSVPHKASRFKSENIICLEKNASLLWGEILTCGRKVNNEVFEFSKFQSLTKVYLENELIFFENIYLEPDSFNPKNITHFEDYTHQLSLFFFDISCDIKKLREQLNLFFSDKKSPYGISETPKKGLIIKILDYKAEQLMEWMNKLAVIINEK